MDIKIRNLSPVAINRLDEIAKKKNISRQEFLKGQIETLAFYREQQNRELYLQQLLEKNIYAMESCFEAVKEMNAFLQMMTQDDEA
ncbi:MULTISPECIES: hypothetical protein [Bacillus]|uniref:Ribbon-helix-helix protein CopG domain-containing protein n=1 Tax=Bacillus pseudomycoides TaxID=64104 RepID=A0AAJ2DLE3_9BACI|nr:hypothetical protein [Bacillus pseudomycoides]MCR8860681.1 hypothetical protein [Bacillus pseudomycoides]MDR4328209.1 hypothetical protein [Bacillus pseudomycoides]MED1534523.1 hypothetical protein [Bacillus pseudomycoides]PDX97184.1 hypothetical protein COO07_28815 [Bacillus pseudomycoides]PEJ23553.1 hypothetical protein CN887_20010 [Bacillus pseudomycoides]